MSVARTHNIGAYIKVVPALGSSAITSLSSDGAPNGVEVTGRVIDRLALSRRYYSAQLAVPFQAQTTGVNATTVQVGLRMMHASSTQTVDFTNLGSSGVVRTFGTTTTSTSIFGSATFDVDLRMAKRYLQPMVMVNLPASSSGRMNYGAAMVFGGADELPQSSAESGTFVGT